MKIIPIQTERVERNPENSLEQWILLQFETKNIKIEDGDILVLSSKIISYFEDRIFSLDDSIPTKEAKEIAAERDQDPRLIQLVLQEADEVIAKRPWVLLTRKNGLYTANAGIDTSNVEDGYAVLWPEDAYSSAKKIQDFIQNHYSLQKLAILIIDSAILPGRKGTIAMCVGHVGISALQDLQGKTDLFNNELRYSSLNIIDSLASAANLVMGEGSEARPMAIIRDYEWHVSKETKNDEMFISPHDDMFPVV